MCCKCYMLQSAFCCKDKTVTEDAFPAHPRQKTVRLPPAKPAEYRPPAQSYKKNGIPIAYVKKKL